MEDVVDLGDEFGECVVGILGLWVGYVIIDDYVDGVLGGGIVFLIGVDVVGECGDDVVVVEEYMIGVLGGVVFMVG